MLRKLLSQFGQTALEYLLMMAFGVSLGISAFKNLNEYFIDNPNGPLGRSINQLRNSFSSDESGRYKRFPIKLPK